MLIDGLIDVLLAVLDGLAGVGAGGERRGGQRGGGGAERGGAAGRGQGRGLLDTAHRLVALVNALMHARTCAVPHLTLFSSLSLSRDLSLSLSSSILSFTLRFALDV